MKFFLAVIIAILVVVVYVLIGIGTFFVLDKRTELPSDFDAGVLMFWPIIIPIWIVVEIVIFPFYVKDYYKKIVRWWRYE